MQWMERFFQPKAKSRRIIGRGGSVLYACKPNGINARIRVMPKKANVCRKVDADAALMSALAACCIDYALAWANCTQRAAGDSGLE